MRLVFLSLCLLGMAVPAHAAECRKADFRLAIDIGHDVVNYGAKSARGEGEYWFNKRLATRLLKAAQRHGYSSAFILNPGDAEIPLYMRTRRARELRADFLLSIHHDSAREFLLLPSQHRGVKTLRGDQFTGHSIFYSERNEDPAASLAFARELGRALRKDNLSPTLHHDGVGRRRLQDAELGIYRYDPLIILHSATMPAVLFEAGVILNRDDEILLRSTRHQDRLIRAILWAFDRYCDKG